MIQFHLKDTPRFYLFLYQLSFIFGGYLVRAETHFARKARIMGWIDIAKQQGYLGGLLLSYFFYKLLEFYNIVSASVQVYWLHAVLFPLEGLVLFFLIRAFAKSGKLI